MKKNTSNFITLTAMVLLVLSCKKKEIEPTGITLTPSSLITYVGATDTLKAALTPPNASPKAINGLGPLAAVCPPSTASIGPPTIRRTAPW